MVVNHFYFFIYFTCSGNKFCLDTALRGKKGGGAEICMLAILRSSVNKINRFGILSKDFVNENITIKVILP